MISNQIIAVTVLKNLVDSHKISTIVEMFSAMKMFSVRSEWKVIIGFFSRSFVYIGTSLKWIWKLKSTKCRDFTFFPGINSCITSIVSFPVLLSYSKCQVCSRRFLTKVINPFLSVGFCKDLWPVSFILFTQLFFKLFVTFISMFHIFYFNLKTLESVSQFGFHCNPLPQEKNSVFDLLNCH